MQNFRDPTFIVAVDFSIAEPGQFQKFCFEGIKVNMVWGRVEVVLGAGERGGGGVWGQREEEGDGYVVGD